MTTRRELLRTLGLGAFGLAFGEWTRAQAAARRDVSWGEYPAEALSAQVPHEKRAHSVLEVYLFGGVCPWETFYVVDEPDYGKARKQMWWTFHDGPESVESVAASCLGGARGPLLHDFARDSHGVMVKLGPFLHGLRDRKDITDRLRLQVLSHDQLAHEVAIPYALTGYHLSSPRLAGVGTSVQRYFMARDAVSREPLSYVITSFRPRLLHMTEGAGASGTHPAYARPLTLHINGDDRFVKALRRDRLGDRRDAADALLSSAMSDYQKRLERDGSPVRSQVWDEYVESARMLRRAPDLAKAFPPALFDPLPGESCGTTEPIALPSMQLRLAAHLLGRPGSPTRHVTVVDTALLHDVNENGYDTHHRHIFDSGRNLTYFFQELAAIINKPGEKNPGKIDLDRTLVVFNTEFGRAPDTQEGDGRNHYPAAYVTAMFGGPVGKAQRGIVGAIGPDATAVDPLLPSETRAATLAAMGIWPFAAEGFSVSDVRGARTTAKAAEKVKERVMGIV